MAEGAGFEPAHDLINSQVPYQLGDPSTLRKTKNPLRMSWRVRPAVVIRLATASLSARDRPAGAISAPIIRAGIIREDVHDADRLTRDGRAVNYPWAAARSLGSMAIRSGWDSTCALTISSALATASASPAR